MPVVSINMDSIQKKLQMAVNSSPSLKQAAKKAVAKDAAELAYEMGEKCARCISNALIESGASGGMIAAVGDVWAGSPQKISDTEYEVGIFIDQNSRPSLRAARTGEAVEDMAALYNNGYSAANYVYGEWHGKRIRSLPYRSPSNFVQQGISDFNGNYGSGYIEGVTAYAELDSDRFS